MRVKTVLALLTICLAVLVPGAAAASWQPVPLPVVVCAPLLEPTPTATPTTDLTPTPTSTLPWLVTPTATKTFALTLISLKMPGNFFSEGDLCSLDLEVFNLGGERLVDLYVLLAVGEEYWCYPSWMHYEQGLDCEPLTIEEGFSGTMNLIPEFTMPEVSPAGPIYFYAAFFEQGCLDLLCLASNGASKEFHLR